MALKMLKSRLDNPSSERVKPLTTATSRTTGRSLQARRLKLWSASPICQGCGRVVTYPGGFELDHMVPLWQGGADSENNCQLLCVWRDDHGDKQGCHADKSAQEAAERGG